MKRIMSVPTVVLMCSCSANWDVDKVVDMESSGNSFDKNLKNEYVELAIIERSRGDWDEVDRLLTKAIEASEGNLVGPDPASSNMISKEGLKELQNAYKDLQAEFKKGARDRKPEAAARAQIGYECMANAYKWNIDADITSCKNYYYSAMAELSDKQVLKNPAESVKNETKTFVKAAPALKIPDELRQAYSEKGKTYMYKDGQYLIYFAFGATEPSQKLDELFKDVVVEYKITNPSKIAVSGYTDTAGSKRVNEALSLRRAKTVSNELVKAGIDEKKIEVNGYGETNLAVPTADNVAEPKNRRTTIEFKE